MYACLTCPLHFWQNDRGLLRAAAVTRGWNGHRIRVSTESEPVEKKIPPPLLPGFELATFRSRVRRSTETLTKSATITSSLYRRIRSSLTGRTWFIDLLKQNQLQQRVDQCILTLSKRSLPFRDKRSRKLNTYETEGGRMTKFPYLLGWGPTNRKAEEKLGRAFCQKLTVPELKK